MGPTNNRISQISGAQAIRVISVFTWIAEHALIKLSLLAYYGRHFPAVGIA